MAHLDAFQSVKQLLTLKATMPKKLNGGKAPDLSKGLWINPHLNLRGAQGNRALDNRGSINPDNGARCLELADIALGLKKPAAREKRTAPRKG
jgi:hypothetical protein